MREDVAQFIARNHSDPKREVEDDVARYRGSSQEERLRDLALVCRSATKMLATNPRWAEILRAKEPPHSSYEAIMIRLRKRSPAPPVERPAE
ncbi:MAG: hypothetical protein JKY65_19130 [Planctomycetes bacterium]|nr:hypothetical protein [Planctomycetota bacterium]